MTKAESGAVMVEYAIITAAMVAVFVVIMGTAKPGLFTLWLVKTRDAFLVSVNGISDIPSVWSELGAR